MDCLSVDHRIFTEIDVDESFKLEHGGEGEGGGRKGKGKKEKIRYIMLSG